MCLPYPPFPTPPHLQGLTAPSKLQEPLQRSSCSAGICIHQQAKPTPELLLLYSCSSPGKSHREMCLQTELQVAGTSPQNKKLAEMWLLQGGTFRAFPNFDALWFATLCSWNLQPRLCCTILQGMETCRKALADFCGVFDQTLTEHLEDFKWAKTSHIPLYSMQWPTALKFPGSQLAEGLKKLCHLDWVLSFPFSSLLTYFICQMKIFVKLVCTSQCLSVIWWDSDPACNPGLCWGTGNKKITAQNRGQDWFSGVSCSQPGHLKLYAVHEMCLELVLASSKTGMSEGLRVFYWKKKMIDHKEGTKLFLVWTFRIFCDNPTAQLQEYQCHWHPTYLLINFLCSVLADCNSTHRTVTTHVGNAKHCCPGL